MSLSLVDYEFAQNKLDSIKAFNGCGVYASSGKRFQYAIFGRDSLEVGEDLLLVDRELVKNILLTMASMQGCKIDIMSEEEPGKIHHEYRTVTVDGKLVPDESIKILNKLSRCWGGTENMLCYYGSIDATPLFIRLIDRYVKEYGPELLNEKIKSIYGYESFMLDCVKRATNWLVDHINQSEWGLLEFKRINPNGIKYQAWKDSDTGYLHEDGTSANADDGIASVEVQGYAYDALLAASDLVAISTEERNYYIDLAKSVQKNTLKLLWVEDKDMPYFAIGLDRDVDGKTRQIRTLTSNSAALLDSRLFSDLPSEDSDKYIRPIVNMIMSNEFITDVGVRTRALRHYNLVDFADYHGSLSSWPKETYDIAKGLRRHGYIDEANKLENTLINAFHRSDDFYEYYFVNQNGEVEYNYRDINPYNLAKPGILDIPESCQAWTVSAIMSIASLELHNRR